MALEGLSLSMTKLSGVEIDFVAALSRLERLFCAETLTRRGVLSSFACFLGTREGAARPAPPGDRRELVVLCHGTPVAVANGKFELSDLAAGRVDLLARCVASALFYSHGVRKSVRVWLMLRETRRTLCW